MRWVGLGQEVLGQACPPSCGLAGLRLVTTPPRFPGVSCFCAPFPIQLIYGL